MRFMKRRYAIRIVSQQLQYILNPHLHNNYANIDIHISRRFHVGQQVVEALLESDVYNVGMNLKAQRETVKKLKKDLKDVYIVTGAQPSRMMAEIFPSWRWGSRSCKLSKIIEESIKLSDDMDRYPIMDNVLFSFSYRPKSLFGYVSVKKVEKIISAARILAGLVIANLDFIRYNVDEVLDGVVLNYTTTDQGEPYNPNRIANLVENLNIQSITGPAPDHDALQNRVRNEVERIQSEMQQYINVELNISEKSTDGYIVVGEYKAGDL